MFSIFLILVQKQCKALSTLATIVAECRQCGQGLRQQLKFYRDAG